MGIRGIRVGTALHDSPWSGCGPNGRDRLLRVVARRVRDHSISARAHEVAGVVTRDPGSGRPLWVIAIQIANPAAESGWHRNGLIPPAVHQDRRGSRRSSRSHEPSTRASPLWNPAGMSYVPRDFSDSRGGTTAQAATQTCRSADLQTSADMQISPTWPRTHESCLRRVDDHRNANPNSDRGFHRNHHVRRGCVGFPPELLAD